MKLTPIQKKIRSSPARFKVLISGRRFGKTTFAISQVLEKGSVPKQMVWYVAPTYRQAEQIVWKELQETLVEKRWVKKFHGGKLRAWLKNGTLIELKGADNFDSLRGVGLNYIVLDEFADIKPQAWFEVLRPTLSDTGGSALFCGTPKGFNWAYDLFMEGQDPDFPEWESFQYTTIDGGFVPQSEIDDARRHLDERTFEQEYLASFINVQGIIYYQFSKEANHTNLTREDMGDRQMLVGMDFNVDPMCAVVGYESTEVVTVNGIIERHQFLNIIGEVELTYSNTEEMAVEIRKRYGRRPIIVYPDPSGKSRKTSAPVGRTDFSILANHGFDVYARKRAPVIVDRINSVNTLICASSGLRRLRINTKECPRLTEALLKHQYKEGTRTPEKGGSPDFSHFSDALGYMVEYRYPVHKTDKLDNEKEPIW